MVVLVLQCQCNWPYSYFSFISDIFRLPGQSPGRAIVLPPASALVSALAAALSAALSAASALAAALSAALSAASALEKC